MSTGKDNAEKKGKRITAAVSDEFNYDVNKSGLFDDLFYSVDDFLEMIELNCPDSDDYLDFVSDLKKHLFGTYFVPMDKRIDMYFAIRGGFLSLKNTMESSDLHDMTKAGIRELLSKCLKMRSRIGKLMREFDVRVIRNAESMRRRAMSLNKDLVADFIDYLEQERQEGQDDQTKKGRGWRRERAFRSLSHDLSAGCQSIVENFNEILKKLKNYKSRLRGYDKRIIFMTHELEGAISMGVGLDSMPGTLSGKEESNEETDSPEYRKEGNIRHYTNFTGTVTDKNGNVIFNVRNAYFTFDESTGEFYWKKGTWLDGIFFGTWIDGTWIQGYDSNGGFHIVPPNEWKRENDQSENHSVMAPESSVQEPDSGHSVQEPDSGHSVQEPDSGHSVQEPDSGHSVQEPDSEFDNNENKEEGIGRYGIPSNVNILASYDVAPDNKGIMFKVKGRQRVMPVDLEGNPFVKNNKGIWMDCQNALFKIYQKNSNSITIVWYKGDWFNGHWIDGTWNNGTFNGIWNNGTFINGYFLKGEFNGGEFQGKIFGNKSTEFKMAPKFNGGEFNGGEFNGAVWNGGTWKEGDWEFGFDSKGNEHEKGDYPYNGEKWNGKSEKNILHEQENEFSTNPASESGSKAEDYELINNEGNVNIVEDYDKAYVNFNGKIKLRDGRVLDAKSASFMLTDPNWYSFDEDDSKFIEEWDDELYMIFEKGSLSSEDNEISNCHFKGCEINGFTVYNSVFENARAKDCTVIDCIFRDGSSMDGGNFFGGTFDGGKFENATFKEGTWLNGDWNEETATWIVGKDINNHNHNENPKTWGKGHEKGTSLSSPASAPASESDSGKQEVRDGVQRQEANGVILPDSPNLIRYDNFTGKPMPVDSDGNEIKVNGKGFSFECKDATFTVNAAKGSSDFGFVRWRSGVLNSGTYHGGTWMGGTFQGDVWENGEFKIGTFDGGTWKDGVFDGGIWEKGTWEKGTWESGTWKGGTWKGGTWMNKKESHWLGGYDAQGNWHGEGNFPKSKNWRIDAKEEPSLGNGTNGKEPEGGKGKVRQKATWPVPEVQPLQVVPSQGGSSSSGSNPKGTKGNGKGNSGKKQDEWKDLLEKLKGVVADEKSVTHAKSKKQFSFKKVTTDSGKFIEIGEFRTSCSNATFVFNYDKNECTWESGTWLDGTWIGGVWNNGKWQKGTWVGKVGPEYWKNGAWDRGIDKKGVEHPIDDAPNRNDWVGHPKSNTDGISIKSLDKKETIEKVTRQIANSFKKYSGNDELVNEVVNRIMILNDNGEQNISRIIRESIEGIKNKDSVSIEALNPSAPHNADNGPASATESQVIPPAVPAEGNGQDGIGAKKVKGTGQESMKKDGNESMKKDEQKKQNSEKHNDPSVPDGTDREGYSVYVNRTGEIKPAGSREFEVNCANATFFYRNANGEEECIWKKGIWKEGTWTGGTWESATGENYWKGGTWKGGKDKNGKNHPEGDPPNRKDWNDTTKDELIEKIANGIVNKFKNDKVLDKIYNEVEDDKQRKDEIKSWIAGEFSSIKEKWINDEDVEKLSQSIGRSVFKVKNQYDDEILKQKQQKQHDEFAKPIIKLDNFSGDSKEDDDFDDCKENEFWVDAKGAYFTYDKVNDLCFWEGGQWLNGFWPKGGRWYGDTGELFWQGGTWNGGYDKEGKYHFKNDPPSILMWHGNPKDEKKRKSGKGKDDKLPDLLDIPAVPNESESPSVPKSTVETDSAHGGSNNGDESDHLIREFGKTGLELESDGNTVMVSNQRGIYFSDEGKDKDKPWVKYENATFKYDKAAESFVWKSGVWIDGYWQDGYWLGSCGPNYWKGGIWKTGLDKNNKIHGHEDPPNRFGWDDLDDPDDYDGSDNPDDPNGSEDSEFFEDSKTQEPANALDETKEQGGYEEEKRRKLTHDYDDNSNYYGSMDGDLSVNKLVNVKSSTLTYEAKKDSFLSKYDSKPLDVSRNQFKVECERGSKFIYDPIHDACYWANGVWLDGHWTGGKWEGSTGPEFWKSGTWDGGFDVTGAFHGSNDSPDKWKKSSDLISVDNETGYLSRAQTGSDSWCHYEKATFTYNPKTDGFTWKSGTWMDGKWNTGVWEGGTWIRGEWKMGLNKGQLKNDSPNNWGYGDPKTSENERTKETLSLMKAGGDEFELSKEAVGATVNDGVITVSNPKSPGRIATRYSGSRFWVHYGKDAEFSYDMNHRSCNWKKGTWIDGYWLHGTWEDGTWEKGRWDEGKWMKGKDSKGKVHGEDDTPNRDGWTGNPLSKELDIDKDHLKIMSEPDFVHGSVLSYKNRTGIVDIPGHGRIACSNRASFTYDKGRDYFVWVNGTWNDGTWNDGKWIDGKWARGKWMKGVDQFGKEHKYSPGGFDGSGNRIPDQPTNTHDWESEADRDRRDQSNEEVTKYRKEFGLELSGLGTHDDDVFENLDNMSTAAISQQQTLESRGGMLGSVCHGRFHFSYGNAMFSLDLKKNKCNWKDGNWDDGTWLDGVWRNGNWYNGTWEKGLWLGGEWFNGEFKSGEWYGDYFRGGRFLKDGVFKGGKFGPENNSDEKRPVFDGGRFEGGVFDGGTWLGGYWKIGPAAVWRKGYDSEGNLKEIPPYMWDANTASNRSLNAGLETGDCDERDGDYDVYRNRTGVIILKNGKSVSVSGATFRYNPKTDDIVWESGDWLGGVWSGETGSKWWKGGNWLGGVDAEEKIHFMGDAPDRARWQGHPDRKKNSGPERQDAPDPKKELEQRPYVGHVANASHPGPWKFTKYTGKEFLMEKDGRISHELWFDCKNATFDYSADRGFTWYGGTWNQGTWFKGTWLGGTFGSTNTGNSIWKNGEFKGGVFRGMSFNGGVFNGGVWESGNWNAGKWLGGWDEKGCWHPEGDFPRASDWVGNPSKEKVGPVADRSEPVGKDVKESKPSYQYSSDNLRELEFRLNDDATNRIEEQDDKKISYHGMTGTFSKDGIRFRCERATFDYMKPDGGKKGWIRWHDGIFHDGVFPEGSVWEAGTWLGGAWEAGVKQWNKADGEPTWLGGWDLNGNYHSKDQPPLPDDYYKPDGKVKTKNGWLDKIEGKVSQDVSADNNSEEFLKSMKAKRNPILDRSENDFVTRVNLDTKQAWEVLPKEKSGLNCGRPVTWIAEDHTGMSTFADSGKVWYDCRRATFTYDGATNEFNWTKGTWLNGTFKGDWMRGTFVGGTWESGTFSGIWNGGTFKDGVFDDSVFNGGTFEGGTFKGGEFNGGTFEGGVFDGGVWASDSRNWKGGTWKGGKDILGRKHSAGDSPDKWKIIIERNASEERKIGDQTIRFQNATFAYDAIENKILRWEDGIWLDGEFKGAQWMNGEFKGGTFKDSTFMKGTFSGGDFDGGIWNYPTNRSCIWLGGNWLGGYDTSEHSSRMGFYHAKGNAPKEFDQWTPDKDPSGKGKDVSKWEEAKKAWLKKEAQRKKKMKPDIDDDELTASKLNGVATRLVVRTRAEEIAGRIAKSERVASRLARYWQSWME